MKHINLIFILLAVVASSALAQTVTPDTIATRLWQQVNAFPQEKLYTQTDRAEYMCGDTIWMRHHVVDALTGVPSYASRYVYVELVNPMGSMVSRVMMRQDENGAIYGYMPTTTDMPSGQYLLRAYTRYMTGTTPDYLFVRSVRLRSVMENSVKITPHYSKSTISLSFADPQTGKPIPKAGVKVSSTDGDMAFTGNSDDGRQVSAILPKAHTDVSTLSVAQNNGRIMVGVLRSEASSTQSDEWLIVHQGGAPLFANRVTSSSLSFSNDMFRDGIVHIVLADNNMNIISERLVFVWRGTDVYDSDNSSAVAAHT